MASAAWTTGSLERRPITSAMRLRCLGSRCWTHNTIAPKSAGSAATRLVIAVTPPADDAIATMSYAGPFFGRGFGRSVRGNLAPQVRRGTPSHLKTATRPESRQQDPHLQP